MTAVALCDGHDAAIVAVNRALRRAGFEVVYIGFNKGVESIVRAAMEEDVDVIGLSSYNGGHLEFVQEIIALQQTLGSPIPIVVGGGGTITPDDTRLLKEMGVAEVFPPGMTMPDIAESIRALCAARRPPATAAASLRDGVRDGDRRALARALTLVDQPTAADDGALGAFLGGLAGHDPAPFVVGVTGVGGAGKSTIIDELLLRYVERESGRVAVLCCDPTTGAPGGGEDGIGGALLGDRIRMLAADHERVFVRSLATRHAAGGISASVGRALQVLRGAPFDLVLVESAGIGQADAPFAGLVDLSLYVMTSEFGSPLQLEKTVMLERADVVVLNKCDNPAAVAALAAVRARLRAERTAGRRPPELVGASAVVHRDAGVNTLFDLVMARRAETIAAATRA